MAIYLTAFWLVILLFSFHPAQGASDYVFKDEQGEDVVLPADLPVFLLDSPGTMAHLAPPHIPEITTQIKKEGLESVRRMTLRLPEPVQEEGEDRILKAYLADKDGLIVGYYVFEPSDQEASFRFNGIINYVRLYLECSHHGLWRKDLAFKFKKSGAS